MKFFNLKKTGVAAGGLSAAGLIAVSLLIAPWEGVRYEPYYDIGGVLTVCYGHTGDDIVQGKRYTKAECLDILERDTIRFDRAVDRCIQTPLPDDTKAAFISFAFNVGEAAMCKSTLARLANQGDLVGACNQLPRWRFVKGHEVRGLLNRRISEKSLCLRGLSPAQS